MGTSTDAILAYGYDLGGDDGGWKLTFVSPDDDVWTEGRESTADAMVRRLAEFHGCAPDDPDGYVNETEVEERSGVEFEPYVSLGCSSYILATKVIRAYRGDSIRITDLDVSEDSDEKLRAAAEAIGIVPNEGPGWYLVSYWG